MKDFSLQLFSLRDTATMAERFRIAAEAGYTGVEFAGYDDMSAAELKCLLREYGLRPAGSHIPIQWLLEDIGQCVRYCAELGTETATCSGWDWEDKSEQTVADQIAFLEKCAGKFEEAGIPFAYHNHYWEFEDHNGKRAIDAVLQNTEKLKLQLDVMWVEYAGVNTVDFIKAHPGRVNLLHYKDMDAAQRNVELGTGIIDLVTLTNFSREYGITEYIVEHQDFYDYPPEEAVRIDADYMKTL